MSVFFRKSVLGFNKDDVKKYIDDLYKKMNDAEAASKQREAKLKNTILELSESLNNANENIAKLIVENDSLKTELEAFRAEKEKIEQLSEVIGKLYLVSKLNAESIIRSAKSIKKQSVEEAERNLDIIEKAHERLLNISQDVQNSSDEYNAKMDEILSSLASTKESIENKYKSIHKSEEKLKSVSSAMSESIKA